MKRDFIFVFILLAILSMANAIPQQLHKRVTTFIPCPGEYYSSPLNVIVSPDPPAAGKVAMYGVSGKLAKAAPKGSVLIVAFLESSSTSEGKIIGKFFAADICTKTVCPASSINTVEQVPVPDVLPYVYSNVVLVSDTAKNIYGCAIAVVGDAGAPKAKAITNLRDLTF